MENYIKRGSLNIHSALDRFLNNEVLLELDITSDEFWEKFEDLLREFHQRNKDLLAKRFLLQDQISTWHKNNDFNLNEYKVFLQEIGYLEEVPADKKIAVLKIVRTLTGLGLKEAKDLVESAPKTVKEAVGKADAEGAKKELEAAGAKCSIK